MQQGKTLTLDSGSAKRMQSFPSSGRRTGDMEVPNKTPYQGQGNRQPLHSNNSSDQESNQHRIWTSCEEDRPNNWQDCYTWPVSAMHKTGQQSGNSDGYDKWARHADQRSPRDKSKTNNITDSSAVPSPPGLQNKTSAFTKHQHIMSSKQHQQTLQAEITRGRGGGGGGLAAGHDGSPGPRYSHPESGSQDAEDRTRLSQIWTALGDLLPQTQIFLDKMDSSEIVSQVMKIRDSLKSASSLVIALGKQPDTETTKLQRDYLDAIFELLRKQETCYLVALQRALVTSEDDHCQHGTAERASPKSDSKSEEPTELEISESSNDELENPTGGAAGDAEFPLNNQRPMIEDHLGQYSDSELDELQQKLNSLNDTPWPESLALPRVPSCVSSHRSPRSPLVKGRSTHSQKFRFDGLPAGSEPSSQPCHASRNTFQRGSNLEGSEDQGPNTARAAAPYPTARSQVKGPCDDKLADSAAGMYGCLPSDIDNDALEDLSQLMKKKQELESFLAERNRQLRDLQQHHDLLKELLVQQEENAAILQGIDDEQPSVWNTDHSKSSPRREENLSGTPSPRSKHAVAAAARSQPSPTQGAAASVKPTSHQKNLLKESSRVKSDAKDSSKFMDDMRTPCEKQDHRMPASSLRLGMPKDRQAAKSPADWSALRASSDSLQYFVDCDRARKKNGDDEEASALNPNLVEKKYGQKNRVDFELEEETAMAGDADDPNSSLALRDELQQGCKDGNDGYLSEYCNTLMRSCEETGCFDNDEISPQPLHNPENSIVMLQQNMSKLMEAKRELESLRNMLHFSTQRRAEKTRPAHESGQRNDHSNDQQVREPRTGGGGGATADNYQTGAHPDMMRLSLLKVANEKLDRLKLVMDDVQRSPGVASLASLPVDRTVSADGASVTKASNTPTVSNFTLRNMQVSDLSTADRSRSQHTADDGRLNASGLDRLLRLLSSEKPRCNDGTLPIPSLKAPRQSAMKEGFFIRNSLPESVSSRGTSQPPSDNRGGLETNSRCPKGNRKGVSKNSSTTNVSNASCIPCISMSADCLPLETGYENTVPTLPPQEKNTKKPCKVIRNQHVEFQHTHVSKPSTAFVRDASQGANYIPNMRSYPKKGVNLGKKNAAVNTERTRHRDCEQNDAIEMKTELKTISHELKILRQDVMSLTRTIGRTSDRPANETRGDGLDPQLLVGLNQSFQQLMADNRRLSDHFTQLRDFVVQQTMRKQCTCEATNENIFNRNKGAEGHEQECGHNRPNSAQLPCDDPEMRCPEQDETWVKSTHRSGAREVRFSGNQSLKQHSGHSLVYLENDLNSQRCRSPSREVICQQGIYGDCFTNNSNGNNSRSHIPNNSPAAAFLQADNVTSRSLGTLLPHSSRNAVCSPANGSPARSQSSGKSANIPEHRFDALKETIYSEVAVFISKHENRPYYLLELIRELQKLKTDALRQQAVDSLDRIISKFLTKDQFQMQVPDEYQLKRETVDEVQLHCGSSLLYDSGIPGFSHFQGANSSDLSGVSGGVAEDEESEEEEEQEQEEEDVDRGDISCCTDPDNLEGKEDKVLGNSSVGEEEEEERDEEGGSGSSHSTGKSDDGSSTDPDRLEEDRCMERGLESESGAEREVLDDDDDGKCSLSSTDDIHYTPDFKSETSSSCPEAETEAAADGLAAEVAEPAGNVTPTQNLDATAEQMGFVTVEFVHAPSAGRSNSENEKGSSVSDESWEKTELPEKDPEFHPTESDTSEEIVEEIIVDDCGSSGSVEELTLDQLHEKLTSISKEEIARRMTLECQGELSAQQVLETIDTEPQNELAGDPGAINQPASPFDKEESRRV